MGPKLSFTIILGLATCSLALNCPGCPITVDVNDPSVSQRLTQTLTSIKSVPTGTEREPVTPTTLDRATSQVVSGVKFTYDFHAKGQRTGKQYECHLVVCAKPWLNQNDVLRYTCVPSDARSKRSLPGSEVEIGINEIENLGDMEKLIITKLVKESQSKYTMGIVKIHKATRQIVSGFLTRLTVEVAETDCLVADVKSQGKCTLKKTGHKTCVVGVWEQPWLQKEQVNIVKCSDNPHVIMYI